jgi:ankyrin repeat protein
MANNRGSAFCDAQSTLLASKPSLQAAAKEGHLEVVEKLLEAKADVNAAPERWYGRTALQAAAEGGHFEVVEKLLEAKADINAAPASWGGRTALQAAAEGGHLEVVEKLLEAKADVNAAASWDGRTALRAAAEGGHLEVVEKLLGAKADVNAAPASWKGRTALQAAAEGGHLEVVEKLLEAKADVNAAPASWKGHTALQAAAEGGHLEVVEKLLGAKANINAAGWDGRTALQAAAEGGHLEVVEKLLGAKADINSAAASWSGRTAQQKNLQHKLITRFSQNKENLFHNTVTQSEAALQEARDQLQPEEDVYVTMEDRLIQLQGAILGINRGLVSTRIMQALTPTAEGINSNGDDLPAVQFLHAKRPKKKRGLPGFVNGVRAAAMADTGASVNVISEDYAQKMRLEIVESDASYRLGNSRSGRCIGKLCTARTYRSYESC